MSTLEKICHFKIQCRAYVVETNGWTTMYHNMSKDRCILNIQQRNYFRTINEAGFGKNMLG
jgi:hypothetical protein